MLSILCSISDDNVLCIDKNHKMFDYTYLEFYKNISKTMARRSPHSACVDQRLMGRGPVPQFAAKAYTGEYPHRDPEPSVGNCSYAIWTISLICISDNYTVVICLISVGDSLHFSPTLWHHCTHLVSPKLCIFQYSTIMPFIIQKGCHSI